MPGTGLQATSVTGPAIMAISTDATPSDPNTGPDPSHRNGIYAAVGDTSGASTVTDEAGVYGFADVSTSSAGVVGESFQGVGLIGFGDTGVVAFGPTQGMLSIGSWGTYGTGDVGIVGDVNATGVGVYGFAGTTAIPNPPTGIGVYARAGSNSQLALRVQGRAKFSRSGRVSVSGSTKTVTLSGVECGQLPSSWRPARRTPPASTCARSCPANGSFKIHLSKKPSKAVTVGWIAFEKP